MSERILVIFPGSLGDFVCFLPTLQIIIEKADRVEVSLAVRGSAFEVAQRLPFLSAVYSLDSRIFSRLFSSSFGEKQEEEKFFSAFSHIFSWFANAHEQVLANLKKCSRYARSFPFFSGQIPEQSHMHVSLYYLRCIGIQEIRCPSLFIGEAQSQWQDQWKEDYSGEKKWSSHTQILVIHPGSGGQKKRWDPNGFRLIAGWWKAEKTDFQRVVLILLGPAEEAERKIWQTVGHVFEGGTVWQAAALLRRATVYLGNDSGLSHLAGAIGARGGVIFGPTQPELWKPLGGTLAVIRNDHFRVTSPNIAGISLSEIPVEKVIATLTRIV
jgi:heptosyltransferase-3